jgi:hypothetical protein
MREVAIHAEAIMKVMEGEVVMPGFIDGHIIFCDALTMTSTLFVGRGISVPGSLSAEQSLSVSDSMSFGISLSLASFMRLRSSSSVVDLLTIGQVFLALLQLRIY